MLYGNFNTTLIYYRYFKGFKTSETDDESHSDSVETITENPEESVHEIDNDNLSGDEDEVLQHSTSEVSPDDITISIDNPSMQPLLGDPTRLVAYMIYTI